MNKATTVLYKGKNLERGSPLVNKLFLQAQQQYLISRVYKQYKLAYWKIVERFYYNKKIDLDVGSEDMQELTEDQRKYINDVFSAVTGNYSIVGSKLKFYAEKTITQFPFDTSSRFEPQEIADNTYAQLLNGLQDKYRNEWRLKDTLVWKDAVLFGRGHALISIYTDEVNKKFIAETIPIKPHDIIIDPLCGGIDIENALYVGWFGDVISLFDIKNNPNKYYAIQSTMKNSNLYEDENKDGEKTSNVKDEDGNINTKDIKINGDLGQTTIENVNNNLASPQPSQTSKVSQQDNTNNYETYAMITTDYDTGKRYFLRWTKSMQLLECKEYESYFKSKRYPIISMPFFADSKEYWSPSPMDYIVPAIIEQVKNIQDIKVNNERQNNPPIIIDKESSSEIGSDPSLTAGKTFKVTLGAEGKKINDVIQIVPTPQIANPLAVYNFMENILGIESGINESIKGNANTKVLGVYDGNKQESVNLFKIPVLNYSTFIKDRLEIFAEGVVKKLKIDVSVKVNGIDGLDYKTISAKERKILGSKQMDVVILSDQDVLNRDIDGRKARIEFLRQYLNSTHINQTELFREMAKIAGMSDDRIKAITTLEKSDYKALEAAHKVLQDIINDIEPARNSNARMLFLDYYRELVESKEDLLTPEWQEKALDYIDYIIPVIEKNELEDLQIEEQKLIDEQNRRLLLSNADSDSGLDPATASGAAPLVNNGRTPVFGGV